MRFLGHALSNSTTGVAWMDLDWGALSRFLPSAGSPRFQMLSRTVSSNENAGHSPDLRRELERMERPELIETLKGLLRDEISTILRVPAAKLDENKSLLEIGMDSLMGVELMTSLENNLAITIPMMALSEAPTIAKLAERLSHTLQTSENGPEETGDSPASHMRAIAQQHGVENLEDVQTAALAVEVGKSETP
jgi:acyl carrier protein